MATSPSKATKKKQPLPTNLGEWLNSKSETVSREKALTSRLVSDLMLAAGARGYGLGIYEPLVDRDGFDLIVDDADTEKPLQLKTRIVNGAKVWEIRKNLLRPSLEMRAEALGFTETVDGLGRGGGVVLQNISEIDTTLATIKIDYLYTDVYVMLALREGLFSGSPKDVSSAQNAARTALIAMHQYAPKKVSLPLNVFVRASGTPQLLALMAIHTTAPGYGWQTPLVQFLNQGPPSPINSHVRSLPEPQRIIYLNQLGLHITNQLKNLGIVVSSAGLAPLPK